MRLFLSLFLLLPSLSFASITFNGVCANLMGTTSTTFNGVNATCGTTTLVSDSFNRADNPSSLGSADVGGAWSVSAGGTVWGILSNRAYVSTTSAGVDYAYIDTQANCTIQVTIVTTGTAPGIFFRLSDSSNFWRLINSGGDSYLQKLVAGAPTTLVGPVAGAADGDVLKVVLSGSTIKAYRNGVQLGTDQSDSFNSTQIRHGMFDVASTASRFDAYSITSP